MSSCQSQLETENQDDETYLSVFLHQLSAYEGIYNKTQILIDSPFTLYEDIKLLVKLSEKDDILPSTFEDLFQMKILKRTAQQMSNRYKLCLRYIQQDDLQKLVDHVRSQGLQGYLRFEGEDNDKHIHFDPDLPNIIEDASEDEQIIKKEQEQQEQHTKLPEKKSVNKQAIITTAMEENKQNSSFKEKATKVSQIQEGEEQIQKKIKAEQIIQTVPKILSESEQASQKQLKYILKQLSQWTKISHGKLLRDLYKCSGDVENLTQYIITGDQEYTWNKEEDELLISVQNDRTKKEIVERLFRERKGELFLNERKQFLNIK